jgi:hypothetical protein
MSNLTLLTTKEIESLLDGSSSVYISTAKRKRLQEILSIRKTSGQISDISLNKSSPAFGKSSLSRLRDSGGGGSCASEFLNSSKSSTSNSIHDNDFVYTLSSSSEQKRQQDIDSPNDIDSISRPVSPLTRSMADIIKFGNNIPCETLVSCNISVKKIISCFESLAYKFVFLMNYKQMFLEKINKYWGCKELLIASKMLNQMYDELSLKLYLDNSWKEDKKSLISFNGGFDTLFEYIDNIIINRNYSNYIDHRDYCANFFVKYYGFGGNFGIEIFIDSIDNIGTSNTLNENLEYEILSIKHFSVYDVKNNKHIKCNDNNINFNEDIQKCIVKYSIDDFNRPLSNDVKKIILNKLNIYCDVKLSSKFNSFQMENDTGDASVSVPIMFC